VGRALFSKFNKIFEYSERSKCKIKTLNPEFNEKWVLTKIPSKCEILISLWDKDTFTADDEIGTTVLEINKQVILF